MRFASSKLGHDKTRPGHKNRFRILCFAFVIFLFALLVRFFTWQDNYWDIGEVQTGVTEGYKNSARQLLNGDFKTFVGDINHFGHPPGYPVLLAGVFKVAGESNTGIQVVQIFCDAIAVALLFMIALELFSFGVAVMASALAAISPQFAYFSVLLLPDSLVVVPILLGIYFLVRARCYQRLINFVLAGAFIGLSCWLRANSLLLPLFLAATATLFVQRGKRLRAASAVVAGALILIAPITIKNALIYRRFVPLSLGAGQTFLEGIADYGEEKKLNIPNTDLGLMRQEAEWYGKPEYGQLLLGPDGIERDRMRLARGFSVVKSYPFWFASVVLRRGIASTRLEPVPVLASEPPVSHDFMRPGLTPVWANERWDELNGDETKYGTQMQSEVINVRPGNDYVFRLLLKLSAGRVQVKATDASGKKVFSAEGVDLVEGVSAEAQPMREIRVPFVSARESQVRLAVANFAVPNSAVLIGSRELIELGPSSQHWLRYVRMPLGLIQRVFKTAWILPLVLVGLILLVKDRQWLTLAIILTVPMYYLVIQSTLHTERRYVYVIHFFLLLPASATLWWLVSWLRTVRKRQTAG